MLILLCFVEALKKQQAELIQNESVNNEEFIQKLAQKTISEHAKVNGGTLSVNQIYATSLLEFKTVKDFLQYLSVPEELLQLFERMSSTIISDSSAS